jgi:hypothetical protein
MLSGCIVSEEEICMTTLPVFCSANTGEKVFSLSLRFEMVDGIVQLPDQHRMNHPFCGVYPSNLPVHNRHCIVYQYFKGLYMYTGDGCTCIGNGVAKTTPTSEVCSVPHKTVITMQADFRGDVYQLRFYLDGKLHGHGVDIPPAMAQAGLTWAVICPSIGTVVRIVDDPPLADSYP